MPTLLLDDKHILKFVIPELELSNTGIVLEGPT